MRPFSSMGNHGARFDYARQITAHLGYLLVKQGDAVGLHACGEHVSLDLPARQAPSHLHTLFDQMEQVEAKGESTLTTISILQLIELVGDLGTDEFLFQLLECYPVGPLID